MVMQQHQGRKVFATQWSWAKYKIIFPHHPTTNKPYLLQIIFFSYFPIITHKAKSRRTDAGLSYKIQISFPITPLPQGLRGV